MALNFRSFHLQTQAVYELNTIIQIAKLTQKIRPYTQKRAPRHHLTAASLTEI